MGMALVILARHIDISIGSQFAVCGVVMGLVAKAGLPVPLAAGSAVLAGAGLGALNGALVAGLGLPSIVVTLATMVAWREGLRWATEGTWVRGLPESLVVGLGRRAGALIVVTAALVFAAAWASRRCAPAARCTPRARTPRRRACWGCGRGGWCSRCLC
jgi:rhamnose transport system permease protein